MDLDGALFNIASASSASASASASSEKQEDATPSKRSNHTADDDDEFDAVSPVADPDAEASAQMTRKLKRNVAALEDANVALENENEILNTRIRDLEEVRSYRRVLGYGGGG